MAEITNPEAVRFSNDRVRRLANSLLSNYRFSKSVLDEWTANPQLATLIAYDNPDVIVDQSAQDGRHPATGVSVNNVMTRASELVADLEANSNAKLNTILAIAQSE